MAEKIVGLIPAAGRGTRSNLSFPKFLLPVPGNGYAPSVALLRWMEAQMQMVTQDVFVGARIEHINEVDRVIRTAKILPQNAPRTMSETIWGMKQRCGDAHVIMGMADTYWESLDTFTMLAYALKDADAALAVWQVPEKSRSKLGMVGFNADCNLTGMIDKPPYTSLEWAWGACGWTEKFWKFIQTGDEHIGFAFQRALQTDTKIKVVKISGGFWNCNTPEDYFDLIRSMKLEK